MSTRPRQLHAAQESLAAGGALVWARRTIYRDEARRSLPQPEMLAASGVPLCRALGGASRQPRAGGLEVR